MVVSMHSGTPINKKTPEYYSPWYRYPLSGETFICTHGAFISKLAEDFLHQVGDVTASPLKLGGPPECEKLPGTL